jgi:hypothetical protein
MHYLLTVAQRNFDEQLIKLNLSQKDLERENDFRLSLENKVVPKFSNYKHSELGSETLSDTDSDGSYPDRERYRLQKNV